MAISWTEATSQALTPDSAKPLITWDDELALTAKVTSPGKPLRKIWARACNCGALKQNRGASGFRARDAAAALSKVIFVVALSMSRDSAKKVCFGDSCYILVTAIISPKRAT